MPHWHSLLYASEDVEKYESEKISRVEVRLKWALRTLPRDTDEFCNATLWRKVCWVSAAEVESGQLPETSSSDFTFLFLLVTFVCFASIIQVWKK